MLHSATVKQYTKPLNFKIIRMYYAIYDGYDYLATGYNATSRYEVREQLFELLKIDTSEKELKQMAGWPLEEVLAVRGWTLDYKTTEPFPSIDDDIEEAAME